MITLMNIFGTILVCSIMLFLIAAAIWGIKCIYREMFPKRNIKGGDAK